MTSRAAWLLAILPSAAGWAGTDPKLKVEEYKCHSSVGGMEIGAEYLVRSLPATGEMHFLPDYLVVEVALYPRKDHPLLVAHSHFTLRLNGRKQLLFPQTPGIVAASLKYPDWERKPTLVGSAGSGDAGVILGRPPATERFPGDPRPGRERLPRAPRAPEPQAPGGILRPPGQEPHEAALSSALEEGPAAAAVSGVLYFAYRGNTKSIRKVELIYSGPAGSLTLPLL